MTNSTNGGDMEATYTSTALAGSTGQRDSKLVQRLRATGAVVADVLAGGIRGDDFSRSFTTQRGAAFAALPANEQNRQLDRGFRP
jgi:hypothetical protein